MKVRQKQKGGGSIPLMDINHSSSRAKNQKNQRKAMKFIKRFIILNRWLLMAHRKAKIGKRVSYFGTFVLVLIDAVINPFLNKNLNKF